MPLRKDIQKFKVALKVFCDFSTESERLRIQSSLYLVTLVSDINKGIKAYLSDIEKGECKKVLGVDFKRLTQREHWLKDNKLRNDPLLTKNTPLKDFGINYEFDGCSIECTQNVVNILETGIDEMIRLLKEAKKKTLTAPLSLFGNFYRKQNREMADEFVETEYEEWKMNVGRLTYERLKEKQTLIVAEFLKMNVLRFAYHPSNREMEQVDLEKVKAFLPSNYKLADDFTEQCAKFRRFISWQGERLVLDYDAYGKYLFQYFYMLSEEDRVALLAMDKWLQLIEQDMAKVKPKVQEATMDDMKEADIDEADQTIAMQRRIKSCIYEMTAEGSLKHLYDYTWVMMVMNETKEMPSFDTPTSFVDYMKQCGVKGMPTRSNITKYYDRARGAFPNWTFTDADGQEAIRRNNVAKRFLNLMRCGNNSR